ncbi:MAG: hypothetical protein KF901_25555 [Myxococcales bacterium]|nr:hypothetical protein [Myxococcales bacterium]
MSDAGALGRCPACSERHPGYLTRVLGADRLRCKRCKTWLCVVDGALLPEPDDAQVWLSVAGDVLQTLDPELSTASERRLALVARGLSGARLDAAAHALAVALDVHVGEPPDGWLTWKEKRTPASYREVERVERELLVQRPGVVKELLGAIGLALLAGLYLGHSSAWAFAGVSSVAMVALFATMKTARWHLREDEWEIPGRWLGQRARISPRRVEAVHLTELRQKNGEARYGVALTVDGKRRVLVQPVLRTASEAHGLARTLEELAGLVPRRAERPRVRVAEDAVERVVEDAVERAEERTRER